MQVDAGSIPPTVATADSYTATEDEDLVVVVPGVLENDNPGPDTCVVGVDFPELAGTVEFHTDGSFDYHPPINFNGATSFVYEMRVTGDDQCTGPADSQATVTITVEPENDAPTALADAFTVLADRTLNIGDPGVLQNDHDVDGDSLVARRISPPANGSLTLQEDGAFSYTPNSGFQGLDAFSYQASDGDLRSTTQLVTLNVTAIPTPRPTVPPPTATPVPPTTAPSPTPVPPASASPEQSQSTEPSGSPVASALPSAAASDVPGSTPAPEPAAGSGGLSIPVLVVLLLLLSLLAAGAAVLVPKWLESRRTGRPLE